MKIAVRPAGTLPYLDERPPSRPSAWPFLLLAVVALVACGVGIGFAVSAAAGGQPTATTSPTPTASATPIVTAAATTLTEEPCRRQPPDAMTARLYEMNGQTMPACTVSTAAMPTATASATIDLGPTFTLTPSQLPQQQQSAEVIYRDRVVYQDRQVIVTSPPQFIYRDVVREVVVTVPPQHIYVVVTATPTPAFTETPAAPTTATATAGMTAVHVPTVLPEATFEVMPTDDLCDGAVLCIPTAVTELEAVEGFRR